MNMVLVAKALLQTRQSVPQSVHYNYRCSSYIRLYCHMRVDIHHGETHRLRVVLF